jgi:cell division septation protein DedD
MPTPVTLFPEVQTPETSDFEIVLGRRQVASVLFVATVLVVVFSAVSYLAGKARIAGAATPMVVAFPPAPAAPVLTTTTAVQPSENAKPEAPLFADPTAGAVYMQLGALDKGYAVVVAEGLRKRGLESFVAPGPTEKVFRVLVGPLPDPASFTRVKDAVDELGLANFARRYEK